MRRLLALLAACLAIVPVTIAQVPTGASLVPAGPSAVPTGTWAAVPGSARALAVGARGVVAIVDAEGVVSRREPRANAWQPVGRDMARVAVDPSGNVWAIDRRAVLQRLDGSQWREVGQGAAALAAAPDGTIVVATDAGNLARFDPAKAAWSAIPGSATRIAVDGRGLLWAVRADGSVARRLGDSWIGVAGRAREIAADVAGNVIVATPEGRVLEWIDEQARWSEVAGAERVAALAVGGGQLWRVDADGSLHAKGIRTQNLALAASEAEAKGRRTMRGTTDPAKVVDTGPLAFTLVLRAAGLAELAIGADGSVYGLTPEGLVRRWAGSQKRFNAFPGNLRRLGVDASGLPYGVGSGSAFVRHDGNAWRLVRLTLGLNDVSLAGVGNALAVATDQKLYRILLNGEVAVGTERLASGAERVVVAPDGSYWYRNTAAILFRCSRQGDCARQGTRATDLAIGPGGTVFLVDDQGNLLRVNAAGQPEIVRRGTVSRVAVGPNDRPWVIEKNGDVYATALFDRDEAVDLQLARATEVTANVTASDPAGNGVIASPPPAPSVSFSQFSFLAVDVPVSAPGFPNLGRGLLDLTVGLDDQIIVTGFDANADPCAARTSGWKGRNWIYSPQRRAFLHLDALKGVQYQSALAGRVLTLGPRLPVPAGAPAVPAFFGAVRACERFHTVEYDAATFAGNAEFFSAGGLSIGVSSLTTRQVPTSTRELTNVLDMDITLDGTLVTIFPMRKIQFVPLGPPYFSNTGEFPGRSDRKWARVGVGATKDVLWGIDVDSDVYEYVKSADRFEKRNLLLNDRAQDIGVGKDGSVFIVDLGGNLKKWNPALRSWTPTGRGAVTRVAVTSKGKPVVANFPTAQRVFIAQ